VNGATTDQTEAIEVHKPTLIDDYERAAADAGEYRKEADSIRGSTIVVGGGFVLIGSAVLYAIWPWIGIIFFVVGGIIVLFCFTYAGPLLWSRPSWENHPLRDVDFSRLAPAEVLFSRTSYFGFPKSRGFRVLVRQDGELREFLVPGSRNETNTDLIVDRLIRALDNKRSTATTA
jgi:hypothetical protein